MAEPYLGRKLASFVRLPEDREEAGLAQFAPGRDGHRDQMLRHGVLISPAVTPVLEESIAAVCERLGIHRHQVTAFAYSSPEINADCLIDGPNSCVLRFTSSLINLLDQEEFRFVVGHELGHFLLDHRAGCKSGSDGSSERFIMERARELSADRLGYLGTDSLECSIRAIMKTASGLGGEHIRFDVSSFVAQGKLLTNAALGEGKTATHPSMLVRSRALLWFSMEIRSIEDIDGSRSGDVQRVDDRVLRDLEKFVDGHVRLAKQDMLESIAVWKSASLIYEAGGFKKAVQTKFAADLGDERLESLKSFFTLYPKDALSEEIAKRLQDALDQAYHEFPSSAQQLEKDGFTRAYSIVRG